MQKTNKRQRTREPLKLVEEKIEIIVGRLKKSKSKYKMKLLTNPKKSSCFRSKCKAARDNMVEKCKLIQSDGKAAAALI